MEKYLKVDVDKIKAYFEAKFEGLRDYIKQNPPTNMNANKLDDEIEQTKLWCGGNVEKFRHGILALQQFELEPSKEMEMIFGLKRHITYAKNNYAIMERLVHDECG
ncbi:MAG: hypothetical protein V1648_00945 [Candidatus Aenigmatarchaeota archaeon]